MYRGYSVIYRKILKFIANKNMNVTGMTANV